MNPNLSLSILGSLADFAIRITLAFGVCLILSRLATTASHRFTLWAAFLYGSAAYWLYLAGTLWPHAQAPGGAVALPQTAQSWYIPQSWSISLGIALGVLGLVYGLTLAYRVISHANKLRHLRWVMSFASEAPAEITALFQSLAYKLGMRPPQLRMLSGASSPATFGWLRPVVVLPTLCAEQNPSELEDILLHELHHVRRRDSFWNALGMGARGLLCFHPAAWYAMKAMRFNRELACDLAVVARDPERRGRYAESLLRFARFNLAQQPASWGIDFAASSEHLTLRVRSILTEARKTSPAMFWLRAASGLALLAVFAGVAPSLGVLLGYSHPLAAGNEPEIALPTANVVKSAPTNRRRTARVTPAAPVIGGEVLAPATDQTDETGTFALSTLPSAPGPHLQHRPGSAAADGNSQPRSIALIDESDSGETGKHRDKSETVQQSATVAAAIWKRVGDLDRH